MFSFKNLSNIEKQVCMIADHENAQLTKGIIKVYKHKMSFMKIHSQRYGATNKRKQLLLG